MLAEEGSGGLLPLAALPLPLGNPVPIWADSFGENEEQTSAPEIVATSTNPLRSYEVKSTVAESGTLGKGRFLSPDRVGGNPRNPQSWNRYVYASNNPLTTVDRNGLWSTKIHNEIINRAFPGLTQQQRQILMNASARMDNPLRGGQNPGRSYQHAMKERLVNR